jgi:transcriptional regulator with XRE-family HTH domain
MAAKGLVRREKSEIVGLADLDELFADPELQGHLEDAACRSDLINGLTEIRCAVGLSQRKVAKAMGTTQSAVSEIEGGATDPRLSTMQRYARAVGARIYVALRAPSPQFEAGSWTSATYRPITGGVVEISISGWMGDYQFREYRQVVGVAPALPHFFGGEIGQVSVPTDDSIDVAL